MATALSTDWMGPASCRSGTVTHACCCPWCNTIGLLASFAFDTIGGVAA
jgi:hypothetical protein